MRGRRCGEAALGPARVVDGGEDVGVGHASQRAAKTRSAPRRSSRKSWTSATRAAMKRASVCGSAGGCEEIHGRRRRRSVTVPPGLVTRMTRTGSPLTPRRRACALALALLPAATRRRAPRRPRSRVRRRRRHRAARRPGLAARRARVVPARRHGASSPVRRGTTATQAELFVARLDRGRRARPGFGGGAASSSGRGVEDAEVFDLALEADGEHPRRRRAAPVDEHAPTRAVPRASSPAGAVTRLPLTARRSAVRRALLTASRRCRTGGSPSPAGAAVDRGRRGSSSSARLLAGGAARHDVQRRRLGRCSPLGGDARACELDVDAAAGSTLTGFGDVAAARRHAVGARRALPRARAGSTPASTAPASS